jgi:hypothetical protein
MPLLLWLTAESGTSENASEPTRGCNYAGGVTRRRIAVATKEVTRSRLMRKMGAGSLPELSRMADRLKLVPDECQRA